MNFSAKTTSGSVVLLLKREKKAKKQKLKGKQSFTIIDMVYMTLTHQNEAQKAKIAAKIGRL